MIKIIALAAALALAAGASGALLGEDALAARASARCSSHHAYRIDSAVIVYRKAAGFDDGVGNPVTLFYACARPNGASVAIASTSDGGGEYPSNDLLRELVLAGNFAGSIMVQGMGDESVCEKYAQSGCPTPVTVVRAAEVRSRRLVSIPVPSGTHGLVLSPSHNRLGAAAWLEPAGSVSTLVATELVPRGRRLRSSPYNLDTGAISGLKLAGKTVTWLKGGVRHRAILHAAG
jgi:hypothetical protein